MRFLHVRAPHRAHLGGNGFSSIAAIGSLLPNPPHLSSRLRPLVGSWLKVLVRGKPFGAKRPASARLPRQSASSLSVSQKARPAASVQDSPSSTLKVLRSDSPPSL